MNHRNLLGSFCPYKIHNTKYIILPFLTFVLPLALYIKTLAPTYIPIDSAELALCMHFWGICHPPGFPLYILAGKIFTGLFPFGTLIFKANLLSAIFAAGTVLVVYLSLVELKVDKKIAFLLSLFLAVSSAFWEFSLSADVFTFAAFLISLTFFLVFKHKPLWAFFALGLSASHFYITAIIFPLLVWYFLREPESSSIALATEDKQRAKETKLKKLLIFGFFFGIGFFPQLLLYFRIQQSPEINWGHAQGFGGFIDFVRRREFGSIFLLANPALKFSVLKVFKHFYLYLASLLVNFGVILPLLTLPALVFGRFFKDRRAILILLSFLVIVVVQLILLSTIDPTGEDNPFQINKFYLSSFILAIFLLGIALRWAGERILGGSFGYLRLLLAALIVIYFLSGLQNFNYSNNYFSQNLVADAMEQLPPGSIAITVSHIFYFGGRYEQQINGQFIGVDLLYFPNEKNRDNEKYQPQLFERAVNRDFVKAVEKNKTLGRAERYILETIAGNLDRPIYILQGTFEEGFFAYLKPYIVPHGLWWKVEPDLTKSPESAKASQNLLENLRNQGLVREDLALKQQQLDLLTYAVSYHTTAVALASIGRYDEALTLLERSFAINRKAENIAREKELIAKTRSLEARQPELIAQKEKLKLTELGNNYYTLGNYRACEGTFEELVLLIPGDAQNFNNLASCQASRGKREEAKANYLKALEIDPNLDLAKRGLEALED